MSTQIEKLLRELPSDYVTASELAALLPPGDNARHAHIKRALAQGLLIQLRRGLYRKAGYLEKSKPHSFEVAQYLLWPSYISLESALSFHGSIPEAIYTTTCVTTQRPHTFNNALGAFDYKKLPPKGFFTDVARVVDNESVYYVANPWKALCDYVYCYKKNWIGMTPLLESLRIEIDDLTILSLELTETLTQYYQSKRVNAFLAGVLREY